LNERGALQQVGIYEKDPFNSYFSGNTVQICPVGALTGASYRFRARPFDLVSTPTACEHCASGCALRTDVRRGKTLRRLAGDDASVNEEWNCDKGRWAFKYLSSKERVASPLVRGDDGELREASWPEAIARVASGLTGKRVGVLVGGRATVEDAYGYSKFARVTLGTNDIDFRSRSHTDEEAAFLASTAVNLKTTYSDIDKADHVVLLNFEPEDESPIVFLRVYKQVRKRSLAVTTVAPFATRGSEKLNANVVSTFDQVTNLTEKSVVLVGERSAEVPGLLSAIAAHTTAKIAWIPRRSGERGALAAGALGNVLPGGRPVSDAEARIDIQSAWGVDSLPTETGLSTSEILSSLNSEGGLDAVVVGGVDPADISAEALGQLLNTFVVSLEISHSAVTAIADVVLPVAAVTEKAGSFLDWEGRERSFEQAIEGALITSRSDVRILSMIADDMAKPISLPSVTSAKKELLSLGKWDGKSAAKPAQPKSAPVSVSGNEAILTSWRQLIDLGSLQAGEENLAGTARKAVAVISAKRAQSLGVANGDLVKISNERGSISIEAHVANISDEKVWLPRNSEGSQTIVTFGAAEGCLVTVVKA